MVSSRLRAYLQLVRLPNLFTAMADSLAGWLLAGGSLGARGWVPLIFASWFLYAGGVVLNDAFDIEVDRRERPRRPLPSGAVPLSHANMLGWGGLVLGLVLAAASRSGAATGVAFAVAVCVLAYDMGGKSTVLGPWLMGGCRGLNVLLGMSAMAFLPGPGLLALAVAYAAFVAGITWISRSEAFAGADLSRHAKLGLFLQNAALAVYAGVATLAYRSGTGLFWMAVGIAVLVGIAAFIDTRARQALEVRTPRSVQATVKAGIFSLVWLHVGILLALRGPIEAVVVGAFWIPAFLIGRWLYAT